MDSYQEDDSDEQDFPRITDLMQDRTRLDRILPRIKAQEEILHNCFR